MKLAGRPNFLLLFLLAGGLLALSGCGSISKNGSGSNNLSLAAGNWSITATSSGANGTFYIGGNVNQSGTALSAKLYITNSLCFDPSTAVSFTGAVSGNNVSLTSSSVNGQVITVAATGTSGSALIGTYSLAGGTCASGDAGTIAANVVPSLTGTWSGPVIGSGGTNVTISFALTQASTASSDGTFALTGNVTYTGSSCSVNGTISSGFVVGPYLVVNANTNETDTSTGSFSFSPALLDSATTPKSMAGTYDVAVGLCAGDTQGMTLTKQ